MIRWRTRAVWLLTAPFLWFADPVPASLLGGGGLALAGLATRAWAAAFIDKNVALATRGPYAFVRHPLYLANLVLGLGIATAGGHWIWPALFLVYYLPVYFVTVRDEERRLVELFGDAYRRYEEGVPAFLPRLTKPGRKRSPARGAGSLPAGAERYLRNREWEAALGAAGVFAVLWTKLALGT